MRKLIIPAALAATALLAGCDGVPTSNSDVPESPLFAHESNSQADLSGTQDGTAITGKSVVNYAKGAPKEWRSNVNLKGDLDAGTYEFYVTLNGGNETLVCSFTVRENGGRQGCSADTDLPGFNMAEVREADTGDVVASGTYDRRGGQRVG